jgi:hypothetical protein
MGGWVVAILTPLGMERRAIDNSVADETRVPATCAWISDELIEDTVSVWSEYLGRPVERDEAIEMLQNVKRLAEVLLEIGEQKHDV